MISNVFKIEMIYVTSNIMYYISINLAEQNKLLTQWSVRTCSVIHCILPWTSFLARLLDGRGLACIIHNYIGQQVQITIALYCLIYYWTLFSFNRNLNSRDIYLVYTIQVTYQSPYKYFILSRQFVVVRYKSCSTSQPSCALMKIVQLYNAQNSNTWHDYNSGVNKSV